LNCSILNATRSPAKGKALRIVAAALKRSTSSAKGRLGVVRNANASSGAKIGTLSALMLNKAVPFVGLP